MKDEKQQPRLVFHFDDRVAAAATQPFPPPRRSSRAAVPTVERSPAPIAAVPPAVEEAADIAVTPASTMVRSAPAPTAPSAPPVPDPSIAAPEPSSLTTTVAPAAAPAVTRFIATIGDDDGCDVFMADSAGAMEQLTTGGKAALSRPLLSPDGRSAAYLSTAGKLCLLDLTDGTDQPLTSAGPLTSFAWSGDSQFIALDGLKVIHRSGEPLTEVGRPGRWPVWLPDGHLLAAWEHRLWVVAWQTGEAAAVADLLLEPRQDLQVSGDGRFAAYVSLTGSAAALRVIDMETKKVTYLDTGSDRVLHPCWSADTGELLITSTYFTDVDGRLVRQARILAVSPDNWSTRAVAHSTCLHGGAARWLPGGREIAFISCGTTGVAAGGAPSLYIAAGNNVDTERAAEEGVRLLMPGPVVGFDVGAVGGKDLAHDERMG